MAAPRSTETRVQDTQRRLADDIDCWVATAGTDAGTPYLIPLSFMWDGTHIVVATPLASVTSRNVQASDRVRIGVGVTRDVVMIDGRARMLAPEDVTDAFAATFAAKSGFDPRAEPNEYRFFAITPVRIQAWREANELAGRDVMRDGTWVTEA
jgi:nitroimidazol reductase NimA-like FMN-containing flavoprotein (pyridoxamine 5'-phosphate oxidase superfamily)